MSLEWFSRMENAVRLSLPEICGEFEEYEIVFDTNTTLKNPTFIFSVGAELDDYIDFCLIHFDPINQEFFAYYFDDETELEVKILFNHLDEMLDFIEVSFYEFLDELEDDDFEDFDEDEFFEKTDILEDDIEWISNNKFIHIEENTLNNEVQHEIHYRLGKVIDTGEGALFRNTISKINGEEYEEDVELYFKNEEAQYILDLVQEYIDEQ